MLDIHCIFYLKIEQHIFPGTYSWISALNLLKGARSCMIWRKNYNYLKFKLNISQLIILKQVNNDINYSSTVVPPPPNTADLGTDEKATVFGNRRYWESYVTFKKTYFGIVNKPFTGAWLPDWLGSQIDSF